MRRIFITGMFAVLMTACGGSVTAPAEVAAATTSKVPATTVAETATSTTTEAPAPATAAPAPTTTAALATTVVEATTTVAPATTVAPVTTTIAPATTTLAPATTTTEPATLDPVLLARFRVARLGFLAGDGEFGSCVINTVGIGAAIRLNDSSVDPTGAELTSLEGCVDDYEARLAADTWGKRIDTPPEFIYASDVPSRIRELLEEAIVAATVEWRNYGPLEYWVAGLDVPAAEELADQYCQRRDDRDEMPKADCLENQHTAKFLVEQAALSAERVAAGRAGGSAGRNGNRDWGIHLFSSSYWICFDDRNFCPYADEQKTAFHEYFHAVQHAHIWSKDRDTRRALMGPMWWSEGGAEYMAQVVSQRLREDGTLTASSWNPYIDRMTWKMEEVREWMADNGGASASTVGYGPDQGVGYEYGTWAHAWLAERFGADVLLDSFYANLNDLGWEGSFVEAYGMSSTAFLAEFDAFVDLPIATQVLILD